MGLLPFYRKFTIYEISTLFKILRLFNCGQDNEFQILIKYCRKIEHSANFLLSVLYTTKSIVFLTFTDYEDKPFLTNRVRGLYWKLRMEPFPALSTDLWPNILSA